MLFVAALMSAGTPADGLAPRADALSYEPADELAEAAARIRAELAAEAGFAAPESPPTPVHRATRAAADGLPSHLVDGDGSAEAVLTAFVAAGAEPEPEAQPAKPDPSADKLPLVSLSSDGTVFTHELTFFEELSSAMTQLLQREELCDVFFEVGPLDGSAEHVRLGGIRGVLAARSPAFRALLFEGEYKHKIEVAMPQWNASAFRAMLGYTHTGRLRLDATFCVELLTLAAHFGLTELVRTCAAFIDENLHHGHACYMLEQADRHDRALFEKCLEFIAWNCTEVIETDGFFALSESVLCKLLGSDELYMPREVDLYHAIVEWGHKRVEEEVAAGRAARRMAEVVAAPMVSPSAARIALAAQLRSKSDSLAVDPEVVLHRRSCGWGC